MVDTASPGAGDHRQPVPAGALMVTSGSALAGQVFVLNGATLSIGRSADNDLRLDDPHVSRRHAVVRRDGRGVYLEDAGSSGGVFLNGVPIDGPTPLRAGDVIGLGSTELRVTGGDLPEGLADADQPTRRIPAAPPTASYRIDGQYGANISNVAGNQYWNQRNEYLLKIAPMRQRARVLLRLGVASVLASVAVYGYIFVVFGRQILRWNEAIFGALGSSDPNAFTPPELSFASLLWLPVALVLMFLGITLVTTSLLMRRRARKTEEAWR